uniref:HEAT repeat domain-containing protein n=1 Tax=Paulinella chromatophora TaxID=39717 RepID=B1X3W3_PAUCH|nr:hypothetical protein PCC_0182 [Paulinella chromatophora]ACB42632.1 hypothetical protein PCC_0182 [Paulinella chromatophora]|eukprot:gb/GEZN01010583.1/.p1 GENE.gb/GEZN01010583.1/~~gb/GEZN01010583.1/.p1  ORF type:complete len:268 (-),score=-2.89 gb/GEZN01010583.1/:127-930(-)
MLENDFIFSEDHHTLAFDPKLLEEELAEETFNDPLDDLDTINSDFTDAADICESGLKLLTGDNDERMEGLRIFCQHRDPRSINLLIPLLEVICPIQRMSAVCALGRNPSPLGLERLLFLLQNDSNGYVRKAVAWTLGKGYSAGPVLTPLIRALKFDIAAVRLRASSSLADAGCMGEARADLAAVELLSSICIDNEPAVRSNSIWSLSRLYDLLLNSRQTESLEIITQVVLYDEDSTVRDEARMMLEQFESSVSADLGLYLLENDWLK